MRQRCRTDQHRHAAKELLLPNMLENLTEACIHHNNRASVQQHSALSTGTMSMLLQLLSPSGTHGSNGRFLMYNIGERQLSKGCKQPSSLGRARGPTPALGMLVKQYHSVLTQTTLVQTR